MTTGGYPPPSDPQNSGSYPPPRFGGAQSGQPADYTTHFPNPITSGYEPPQQNPPQYGAPAGAGGQYGQPQYGQPQYGQQQQYGAPSDQQFGGQQFGQPAAPQYNAPPQFGDPQASQFGAPGGGPQFGAPQFGAPQPGFGPAGGAPGELLPRLGARVIDGLIVGVPLAILSTVLTIIGGTFLAIIVGILWGAAMVGYAAYLESTQGATIGKKVLGLSVLGPDGGRPTLEQAAKRNAYFGLYALSGIPYIGWIAILAMTGAMIYIAVTIENNPGKQGFHDVFAGGTRVVKP
ncbi:MAG: RDD family protein [Rhodococcus sp.]|nr:RDD family protein [Rhodococcus sp. (in: high G+C Gram-positive bacteria)]